jgi:hypothetical protein
MKFDLHEPAVNLNGEPLKAPKPGATPDPTTGQFATADLVNRSLADLVCDALLTPQDGASGADMLHRYKLAKRIHGCVEAVDLSSDDLSVILADVLRNIKAPLLYGQLVDALEI